MLYLGHVVSEKGVVTNPVKIAAVQDWPEPTNVRKVQQFLGLAGYYLRFVQGFSVVGQPLTALTKKGMPFEFTVECRQAFEDMKEQLMTAPVLNYLCDEGHLILDMDASNAAIWGVLSQDQDGEERMLSYGSATLLPCERNYCVTRHKLLAVVHFTSQFCQYLLGHPFTLRTDHGSPRWLVNLKFP